MDSVRKREFLTKEFDQIRLKSFTQSFTYNNDTGYNVMGVLRAPRADGTESIVISAPWTCGDGQDNSYGIGLLMSLAQFAAKESMWAKDLIFLVLDKTPTGSLAWLNSYHGLPEQGNISQFLKIRIKI
jgi:glycosylphosphatidylinositol transamidase